MNQEIISLLKAALECSIYLNPTDPGLSYEEILQVGKRLGFQAGEVGDAARYAGAQHTSVTRIIPDATTRSSWVFFYHEEPDYRNFDALDFVVSELNTRVKVDGAKSAQVERCVIVERALAKHDSTQRRRGCDHLSSDG